MRTPPTSVLAALLLCAIAVAAAPSAAAQGGDVRFVAFDQYSDVDVARLGLEPCAQSSFTRDPAHQAVHFREEDPGAQPAPLFPTGYISRGCGNVTLELPIPPGTDHLHLRFLQDRVISLFGVGQSDVSAGIDFRQAVQLFLDGAPQPPLELFPVNATGAQPTAFEHPTLRPEGARALRIHWTMAETGMVFAPAFPTGTAYASTLERIVVEFSGVPSTSTTEVRDGGSGTLHLDEIQVHANATARSPEGLRNDLRFRLTAGWEFVEVRAPDGAVLREAGTRIAAGESGYDRGKPLQESAPDFFQVTLSSSLLELHGDGAYTLVARRVTGLDINEALLPVAIALLLSPAPFALIAYMRTRAFEREAFGSFRRSARYLRIALVVALLYYVVVVGSALAGGRLDLMAVLPLSTEAALLYLQVVVAIGAFLALSLVARELYRITKPKPVEAAGAVDLEP